MKRRLTIGLLMEVNEYYDYNYPRPKVQDIFDELVTYEAVSMNDIIEEFEMASGQNII